MKQPNLCTWVTSDKPKVIQDKQRVQNCINKHMYMDNPSLTLPSLCLHTKHFYFTNTSNIIRARHRELKINVMIER